MNQSGTFKEYFFMAKIFESPSRFGINGGRVSKLSICWGDRYEDESLVYRYDRGLDFDIAPAGLVDQIMEQLLHPSGGNSNNSTVIVHREIIERQTPGNRQAVRYVPQIVKAEEPQAKPKILVVSKQSGRTVLSMQTPITWENAQ